MAPTLFVLSIAGVAHAQGTMDFSGATTLMTTFKTFALLGYGMVVYACVAAVQRMTRRLGLHCPHCNRSLSGPQSHRVVESGNCSHCGLAIF